MSQDKAQAGLLNTAPLSFLSGPWAYQSKQLYLLLGSGPVPSSPLLSSVLPQHFPRTLKEPLINPTFPTATTTGLNHQSHVSLL